MRIKISDANHWQDFDDHNLVAESWGLIVDGQRFSYTLNYKRSTTMYQSINMGIGYPYHPSVNIVLSVIIPFDVNDPLSTIERLERMKMLA